MRLTEEQWMLSGGAGAEWRAVSGLRLKLALGGLREALALMRRGVPRNLSRYALDESIEFFLRAKTRVRDRIALHPGFDCWLSITRTFVQTRRPVEEWLEHFTLFQSFAVALAAELGATRAFGVRLSRGGRFHATGTRVFFEFGPERAGQYAEVRAASGKLSAATPGALLRLLPEITPTMFSEFRDPLVMQPISVQVPARPAREAELRFAGVLSSALRRMRTVDEPLYEELNDFLRIIVPLDNPKNMGSVSSSYQNLRGALCLSHSDDVLLQEETLIHEFSHQKLNLVAEADPMLVPGQGAQVFFSPLRPDARRLRGLFLGAHAFVNVNRYLLRVRARGGLNPRERGSLARNVAQRIFHVEDMLRAVSGYAELTDFGRRCMSRLWREHMLHCHAVRRFPAAALEEARAGLRQQRLAHALGLTGFHRP